MFKTLKPLEDGQISTAADAMMTSTPCLIRMDESGIYLLLTACPDYAIDFSCVRPAADNSGWEAAPLTSLQYAVLLEWSKVAMPAICARWQAIQAGSAVTSGDQSV